MDRLIPDAKDKKGHHIHCNLSDCIDLPDGSDGEMNIQGLNVDGDDSVDALSELAEIDRDPNRAFLGRIPLCGTPEGPQPAGDDGESAASTVKL